MRLFFGSCLLIATMATGARAQDAGAEPASTAAESPAVVTQAPPATTAQAESAPTTPAATESGKKSYEEFRKQELQLGIKRTRNALIATSASFVVGLSLVIPAFTSNNCREDQSSNQYSCTTTGKALLGVGAPFLIVGFYGVIVSGIMFGVRRGKLRRLNERMAYESQAKVRWDPLRSSFVF